jgi:hypothetical protein
MVSMLPAKTVLTCLRKTIVTVAVGHRPTPRLCQSDERGSKTGQPEHKTTVVHHFP